MPIEIAVYLGAGFLTMVIDLVLHATGVRKVESLDDGIRMLSLFPPAVGYIMAIAAFVFVVPFWPLFLLQDLRIVLKRR